VEYRFEVAAIAVDWTVIIVAGTLLGLADRSDTNNPQRRQAGQRFAAFRLQNESMSSLLLVSTCDESTSAAASCPKAMAAQTAKSAVLTLIVDGAENPAGSGDFRRMDPAKLPRS